MKTFIGKYYLISFYIFSLIFSLALLPLHFVFKNVGDYSVSFTQFSPTIAVLIISLMLKDKSIILNIKKHFRVDSLVIKWIIPAILIPGVCIFVSSYIMSFYEIIYVKWDGDILFYLFSFIAIMIGSVVEEIGWRGYLLPNLQKKYTPFVSSLIVGVLWGIWHFNFMGGILGFVLYTVTIVEMSILMTWMYNKSNGNLWLMIVWHLVFNLSSRIFLWQRFTVHLFVVEIIVFGVVCLLFLIIDKDKFFSKNNISNIE